jgi:hypothetical protein
MLETKVELLPKGSILFQIAEAEAQFLREYSVEESSFVDFLRE